MPALKNQKQEAFSQAIAAGLSGAKAMVAAGYSDNSRNAWALKRNPRIVARVDEIKRRLEGREIQVVRKMEMNGLAVRTLTKQWVLDRLTEAAMLGLALQEDGKPLATFNLPAANRALELLGKELGMFIDRKESGRPGDFAGLTDQELESRLMQTLMDRGLSEEQARILVARQRVRGGMLDPSTRVAPPTVTDIEPSSSEVAVDEAKPSPGERAKR